MQPIYFQEFIASEEKRREAWRRRFDNRDGWAVRAEQRPPRGRAADRCRQGQRGHHAERRQPPSGLGRAGRQGDRVARQRDLRALPRLRAAHRARGIEREFQASGTVGPCRACGGIVKSATISFGQPMPQLPMQRAHEETMACDLFVVLGSSLSVFPAADFRCAPSRTARAGHRQPRSHRDGPARRPRHSCRHRRDARCSDRRVVTARDSARTRALTCDRQASPSRSMNSTGMCRCVASARPSRGRERSAPSPNRPPAPSRTR